MLAVAWSVMVGAAPWVAVADADVPAGFTGWKPMYTPGFAETTWKYYEGGKYAGRLMDDVDFRAMSARMAYGAQSLGTGVGSGYSSSAARGAEIAGTLKTVSAGAGTAATLRVLKGDTLGVMARLKSWGALKTLGVIGLGVTSFEIGWKIGSSVADLFGFGQDGDAPEASPTGSGRYEAVEERIYAPGEEIGFSGVEAPGSGGVVQFRPVGGAGVYTEMRPYGVEESAGKCQFDRVGLLPEGAVFVPTGVFSTTCEGQAFKLLKGVFWVPLQVSHLPGEPGGSPSSEKKGTSQVPESAANSTVIVEHCLEDGSCASFGGWWWNHDPEAKEATHVVQPGLDPADPLSVRIPVPAVGENYVHFDERLESLGLVPEPKVLAESAIDPRVGPEGVSTTSPYIGSNVEPETHVKVRYNPATAPETEVEQGIEGGGSGWSPPAIPSIDLSPLAETGLGCDVFPFGLPCYLVEVVSSLDVAPRCPKFEVPLYGGHEMVLDTCVLEGALSVWRPVFLAIASIGIVVMFAGLAGVGGGGEDE